MKFTPCRGLAQAFCTRGAWPEETRGKITEHRKRGRELFHDLENGKRGKQQSGWGSLSRVAETE